MLSIITCTASTSIRGLYIFCCSPINFVSISESLPPDNATSILSPSSNSEYPAHALWNFLVKMFKGSKVKVKVMVNVPVNYIATPKSFFTSSITKVDSSEPNIGICPSTLRINSW